jgi:hypothetical protein
MKPRSLLVLFGEARIQWMHQIKRKDVTERRIATTLRELSPEFLPSMDDPTSDEYKEIGKTLIKIGSKYI